MIARICDKSWCAMTEYYFRWVFLIFAVLLIGVLTRTEFFRKLIGKVREIESLEIKKSRIDTGMFIYDFETDGEKVKLLVYQGVAQQLNTEKCCGCKK